MLQLMYGFKKILANENLTNTWMRWYSYINIQHCKAVLFIPLHCLGWFLAFAQCQLEQTWVPLWTLVGLSGRRWMNEKKKKNCQSYQRRKDVLHLGSSLQCWTEYPWKFKSASLWHCLLSSQAAYDKDTMSSALVGMSDLSDEILLCILRHVPVSDLLMNVAQVSSKFHTLCHDKTLLSNVSLSEEYLVMLHITSDEECFSWYL